MGQVVDKKVKIIEVLRHSSLPKLVYRYVTSSYYDLQIRRKAESWEIELTLKHLNQPLEKSFEERLFSDYVEDPRVFAAELEGKLVGWIELGYQKWNNRMRVWQFLVKDGFRRKGIGKALMKHGIKVAKERGARMLVLETQTCNVPAINFYLSQGFELLGFDKAAYSNEDIERREVRLEFGLRL